MGTNIQVPSRQLYLQYLSPPPPLKKIREMNTKGVDSQKVNVSAPNPPKLCL
jgi:hypothetical protein